MGKKAMVFFILLGVFVSLSGCATVPKQADLELQGLRNQVVALETQVQQKDQEITSLRDALSRVTEEKATATKQKRETSSVGEVKSRPTMKQIQTALSHAGFDPGPIDGSKGRKTKEAIKAFQKANGLRADGAVGKKTWALLRDFLEKKEK
jgi:peptidoglycan hydrolase-like protein with peptidoglycan-binding domain